MHRIQQNVHAFHHDAMGGTRKAIFPLFSTYLVCTERHARLVFRAAAQNTRFRRGFLQLFLELEFRSG